MAEAFLRESVAWRNHGVLLGLDHQPAAIAMIAQHANERGEIDRPVAGHRKGAVDDGLEKAPVAVARQPYHRRPHVLAVDVTDALDVFRSEERRVGKECRSRWSP